ncbi:helix-turn-helix domain-containing protein [Paucibacter sp. TC2R-5]|uniref:helix-turn-helix domain-containing protein n=1 Tax=Paucibacter sp. TC2R-5 TaxID=2893555 RepID=UPI0021E44514|nr:helix-turn-helix transcriptional regulator [Paucibacter sp. TC2R-5]MCV2359666.1 helix-turn-helix domain-containing protein [Paucibacter sp. TC2R-5]
MSEIGKRLATWRGELDLSQAAFAAQISIHLGQLKKYEQGVTTPGGEALAAIASTGVNLNWLLTGQGLMRAPQQAQALPAEMAAAGDIARAVADLPEAANAPKKNVLPPHLKHLEHRLYALVGLLDQMPDAEADALVAEFGSRAHTLQQLAELRSTVQQLRSAKGGKRA